MYEYSTEVHSRWFERRFIGCVEVMDDKKYRFKLKGTASGRCNGFGFVQIPTQFTPAAIAREGEGRERRTGWKMGRGRAHTVGRSSHPSKRAKKIRQILAGRDMGHEEEMEERSDKGGRGRRRSEPLAAFIPLSRSPNRRCQFSSWYSALSDVFLVHRTVPLPPTDAVNKV